MYLSYLRSLLLYIGIAVAINATAQSGIFVTGNRCIKSDISVNFKSFSPDTIITAFRIIPSSQDTLKLNINNNFDFTITFKSDTVVSVIFRMTTKFATYSDTIIVNSLPDPQLGKDGAYCKDSIVLKPGIFNTYNWQNNSTLDSIIVTKSGSYFVEVTNQYGCKKRDSIELILLQIPTPKLPAHDTTLCQTTWTVSPGSFVAYKWNDLSSSTKSSLTIDTSGFYWVDVTNADGCTSRDSIKVTFNPLPKPDLGNDTAYCGESFTLNSGTFDKYKWSNSLTTETIVIRQSGVYWVQVENSFKCQKKDSILVILLDLPQPYLGGDSTMCQQIYTITPGRFQSYLWLNDSSTKATKVLDTSGIYVVEVQDKNGCKNKDSIKITFQNLPLVELGKDVVHCGTQFILKPDSISASLSYFWSNGEKRDSTIIKSTGTYWLTVVDSNLCASNDSINIRFNQLPRSNIINDTSQCGVFITLDPGEYKSYLWFDGDTSRIKTFTTSINNVTLRIIDSNNCSSNSTFSVDIFSQDTLNLFDVKQCGGVVTIDPGVYSSYLWSDSSTKRKQTLTKSTSKLWLRVSNENGCIATDTIDVLIRPLPMCKFSVNDEKQCLGVNDFEFTANNMAASVKYSWFENEVLLNTVKSFNLKYTKAGINNIKLIVEDTFGCIDSFSRTIEIVKNDTIQYQPVLVDSACLGDNIVLIGSSKQATIVKIFNDESKLISSTVKETDSLPLFFANSGMYHLEITLVSGCSDTIYDSINIKSLPTQMYFDNSVLCNENNNIRLKTKFPLNMVDSIQLNQMKWSGKLSDSSSYSNDITVQTGQNTGLKMRIYKANCFFDTIISIKVNSPSLAKIENNADTLLTYSLSGFDLFLSANRSVNNVSYEWLLNDSFLSNSDFVSMNIKQVGLYSIFLKTKNEDNCPKSDSISFRIQTATKIFVPPFFTPNGDRKNDALEILGLSRSAKFHIYNMSGNLIYGHASDGEWWDGKYPNGVDAPPGSYLVVVEDRAGNKSEKWIFELIRE